jgi:two-component system, OmpR family, sensor histidine kinase KdpD
MSERIASAGKEDKRLSESYIPLPSTFFERRVRASGRQALLFSTECALGVVSVVLVGFLTHWLQWLLPVAVLLYLLIIVPVALWCGFWQAAVVSLSAVGVQSYFTARMASTNPAVDPANPIELFAFILTALVISRLSARVTEHARSSDSWGGQMQDLYEFTRRTLQMNL